MKITADTNVLVRAAVKDDLSESRAAAILLQGADLVSVPTPALCEFVWVLARGYGIQNAEIAGAIRGLIASAKIETNRPAIDAGLALLEKGGDFADGVIAFEGASLGADTFASFDKDAAGLLKGENYNTLLLS